MILMNELFSLKNILPGVHSLVDAEVSENGGWTSGDAAACVDVHFKTLVVDHVVDVLGCLEVLFGFVGGGEIVDWEMHDG